MSDITLDIYSLDRAYRPFPQFKDWASKTSVNEGRWDRYNQSLHNRSNVSAEALGRARQIATRAAALDTGAIEGLYDVDRGFTFTVAFETAAWEVSLSNKGENVRPLFEAQLHAYDYVLDLATKAEPISEAVIRALHEQVCRAQTTYHVMTALGPQEQSLPKGVYKSLPNHVRTRQAKSHSYAPVDVTPAEMARFVEQLRTPDFLSAHPVIQAAYAHYAFVVIHPFADGNGRVARAIASAFTYRAISMPVIILSEHKNLYLDSLEGADRGTYQDFVDFMMERSLDTIQLVEESVLSSSAPNLDTGAEAIKSLYITRGGYSHDEIDASGNRVLQSTTEAFNKIIARVRSEKLSGSVLMDTSANNAKATHRFPLSGARGFRLLFNTSSPASASVAREYFLLLPKDADSNDDILLVRSGANETFVARMADTTPAVSGILLMRIGMFAERAVGELLAELQIAAHRRLKEGQ